MPSWSTAIPFGKFLAVGPLNTMIDVGMLHRIKAPWGLPLLSGRGKGGSRRLDALSYICLLRVV
jgi:hypothetical protein